MTPSAAPPNRRPPPLDVIAAEVLAELAFMVADAEHHTLDGAVHWRCAEVSYTGPRGGTLRCWYTDDFAAELAANLLGHEPDDTAAHAAADDAMREFMSVWCGHVLTRWNGDGTAFAPGAARLRADAAPPPDHAALARVFFVNGAPFACSHEGAEGDG